MPTHPIEVWLGFTALVGGLLVLDLGFLNRRAQVSSVRESTPSLAWWYPPRGVRRGRE